MSLVRDPVLLDASQLRLLFPAHVAVDSKQVVTDLGASAARRFPELGIGARLESVFEVSPAGSLATLAAQSTPVTLRSRAGLPVLRGVVVASGNGFVFLVGHMDGVVDLTEEDFSVSDAAPELAEALLKSQISNRLKSDFLAGLSHELRTQLHGVIGIIGSLSDSSLSEAQGEMVALIEESGGALNRVVEEVLNFVRLEDGPADMVEAPFVLEQELSQVADDIEGEADAKGLDLMVELDFDSQASFVGDAARIRLVVTNLLASAIRATDVGEIGLTATLGGAAASPKLLLEVAGGSSGFDPETAVGLLQRVSVGDGVTPPSVGPYGFSLAICKALVDQMGGEIKVQTTTEARSVFSVVLPLRPATRAQSAALESVSAILDATPSDDDSDDPVRALVAEDHPANRRIIELMLAPMGVEVTLVANGAEAVEAFKQHDWELILLDMQMPVLDGVSAARAMRDLEIGLGRARTPIAMLSANVLPRHVDDALAAGADHFIAKPVTPAALARGLDELVRAAAINASRATRG